MSRFGEFQLWQIYDEDLINKQDNNGETALFEAVSNNEFDTVNWLINANANLSISNNKGITPILESIIQGNKAIEKLLRRKGAELTDIELVNYKSNSIIIGNEKINSFTLHNCELDYVVLLEVEHLNIINSKIKKLSLKNLKCNHLNIAHSTINNANLKKSYIKKGTINNCSIRNSDLSNARFIECSFSDSDFSNSIFDSMIVHSSYFTNLKVNNVFVGKLHLATVQLLGELLASMSLKEIALMEKSTLCFEGNSQDLKRYFYAYKDKYDFSESSVFIKDIESDRLIIEITLPALPPAWILEKA